MGTTYRHKQTFQSSDVADGDYFGYSVAIDGATLAVGATGEDIGGNDNAGAVYIFTRDGNTWTQVQKIQASDPTTGAAFGYSIAMYGGVYPYFPIE